MLVRTTHTPTVDYTKWKDLVYNVRFMITKGKMMAYNKNLLGEAIVLEFRRSDTENTGILHINEMSRCLRRCKMISITPYQVNNILGQSDPDEEGFVKYSDFIEPCLAHLNKNFFFGVLLQKNRQMESGIVQADKVRHKSAEEFDSIELFRYFMKYDRNQNGVLDFGEYSACLAECGMNLKRSEIITMTLNADVDGNGEIEFEEFVTKF